MGRKLMRVPLDFNYPLKKVWEGYINPYYKECPQCRAGYSKAYDLIANHINSLVWDSEAHKNEDYHKLTTFLCDRPYDGSSICRDSMDAYRAIKRLGELTGLGEDWTICKNCNGDGIEPSVKEKYESWQQYDPPKGEGYQLWETTSEGSPVSPVFNTLEELCEWCEDNATTFAKFKTTKEKWMEMLREDKVCHQEGNMIFL